MLVALLIIVGVTVALYVAAFKNDNDGAGIGAMFMTFFCLLFALFCMRFSLGSQTLSGYIYSSSDAFGYTTAHIRFSENAGSDKQPSFCVETDSDAGRAIQQYSGSGKKVEVKIPAYFYWTNNIFACGTTAMTVQEAKS